MPVAVPPTHLQGRALTSACQIVLPGAPHIFIFMHTHSFMHTPFMSRAEQTGRSCSFAGCHWLRWIRQSEASKEYGQPYMYLVNILSVPGGLCLPSRPPSGKRT